MSDELPWVVEGFFDLNSIGWGVRARCVAKDIADTLVNAARRDFPKMQWRVRDTRLDVPTAPIGKCDGCDRPATHRDGKYACCGAPQHCVAAIPPAPLDCAPDVKPLTVACGRVFLGNEWAKRTGCVKEAGHDGCHHGVNGNTRFGFDDSQSVAPDVNPTNWTADVADMAAKKARVTPHDPDRGCAGCEHYRPYDGVRPHRCVAAGSTLLSARVTEGAPDWCPKRKAAPRKLHPADCAHDSTDTVSVPHMPVDPCGFVSDANHLACVFPRGHKGWHRTPPVVTPPPPLDANAVRAIVAEELRRRDEADHLHAQQREAQLMQSILPAEDRMRAIVRDEIASFGERLSGRIVGGRLASGALADAIEYASGAATEPSK